MKLSSVLSLFESFDEEMEGCSATKSIYENLMIDNINRSILTISAIKGYSSSGHTFCVILIILSGK